MIRLHGRPARRIEKLHEDRRWHHAVELAAQLAAQTNLALNLDSSI